MPAYMLAIVFGVIISIYSMKKQKDEKAIRNKKKLFFFHLYKNIDSSLFDQKETLISYLAHLFSLSLCYLSSSVKLLESLGGFNADSTSILALNSGDSSETISVYLRA
jgi:hypothetical protein